ncbi:MAG: glycosyltransferase [Clostridia bacterium]|nr:glycosyltransferase [Clostridia bacterium]
MNKEMNIIQSLDTFYPNFDGPVQVVTNYTKSMIKHDNVKVKVVVPKYPKYVDTLPLDIYRTKSMGKKTGYRMATPGRDGKLKKYFKENKVDIIHFHSPFTMARFLVKMGKKHDIPTVFTFHTKFRDDFERLLKPKFLQNFMMRYIMKPINACDYVLTVSNGAADVLREYGYKGKIDVIRNGTDLVCTDEARERVKEVNEKYNLENEENVFISVGRIVSNKRLDIPLNALKIVKDKGYKFKYLIVGAGDHENNLKELVKELGLEDYVIFTGKVMDRQLLSAHYLRSDLFLFPSTFDTASLAPIEAAAMSLPTLMTKGCATAEILTADVNGLLAEEENIEDWASKIIYAIENKDKMAKMKEKTYSEVYRTWDDVCDEVLAKYQEYIENYKKKKK